MRFQDVILRGVAASRPAATTVPVGTLYYSTDTAVTERSNGTTWDTYTDAGSSGITQLTGAVTAGPGSGSQVTTITNDAVTTAKIINDAVTFAKIQNITDVRLLGRSAGSAGDVQEITVVGATLAAGVLTVTSGGDWDSTIVKSADQSVTNSATLVDVTDLVKAVLANESWHFEFLILYSGDDASADLKWGLAISAGTMTGNTFHSGLGNTNASQTTGTAYNASAGATAVNGTDAVDGVRSIWARATVTFTTNGNLTLQFAQNAATVGKTVKIRLGSIMRCKKIA